MIIELVARGKSPDVVLTADTGSERPETIAFLPLFQRWMHDRRYAHVAGIVDPKYAFRYPLREWGWQRDDCAARIRDAGLLVPIKSACFFCGAAKPHEIATLPSMVPAPHRPDRNTRGTTATHRRRTVAVVDQGTTGIDDGVHPPPRAARGGGNR